MIENKESLLTVYTAEKSMYLQMLRTVREQAALANNNVELAFPQGSIGFLNATSPIGTKFQPADVIGPQSQKKSARGEAIQGILWFDFFHP